MKAIEMLFYLLLGIISQCLGQINSSNEVSYINDLITEECNCFNITGDTVSERLQKITPLKSNIERLVVYIYKDITTNKTYMYTPKREKQQSFPDLSYDAGDELSMIDSETINYLLHSSPQHVNTNFPVLNVTVSSQDQPYQGYDEDEQEDEPKLETEEDLVDLPDYFNEQLTNTVPETVNKIKDFYSSLNVNNKQQTQKNPYNEDFDSLTTIPEQTFPFLNENFEMQVHPSVFQYNAQDIPPMTNYYSNIFQSDNANPTIHPIDEEQQIGHAIDDPKLLSVPPDFEDIDISKIEPTLYPQTEISSSEDNDIAKEINVNDHILPHHRKYLTFDKWFNQQMHRINKTGKTSNKNIDLLSLKLLIEKTLHDNHMYITKDGVLIDTFGNALNAANLKLRPILIGNSVLYNILLNVKNNKVGIPPDMPYLEAVLVTLIYPPKVLGVIPLSKTYVPRISYRREYNYWPPKRLPTFCLGGNCLSKDPLFVMRNAFHQNNKHHLYDFKKSHAKFKLIGPAKQKYTSRPYAIASRNKFSYKPLVYERPPGDIDYDIQDNLSYGKQNLIKAIKSLLTFSANKNKENDKIETIKNLLLNEELPEDYPYDDEDEAVLEPDFRIIGGSAATGSGTPVSSRGRSGNSVDR